MRENCARERDRKDSARRGRVSGQCPLPVPSDAASCLRHTRTHSHTHTDWNTRGNQDLLSGDWRKVREENLRRSAAAEGHEEICSVSHRFAQPACIQMRFLHSSRQYKIHFQSYNTVPIKGLYMKSCTQYTLFWTRQDCRQARHIWSQTHHFHVGFHLSAYQNCAGKMQVRSRSLHALNSAAFHSCSSQSFQLS